MPLSWNEIRHRAIAFSREWQGEAREAGERQSFWNDFFNVFGVIRMLSLVLCLVALNTPRPALSQISLVSIGYTNDGGLQPHQSRQQLPSSSLTGERPRTDTPGGATSLTSLGKDPDAHLIVYGDSVLPL